MKKLLSFVKIEHTLFSLPLIYSGVFLASRAAFPSWRILILVLTAATGARTVAFALNRIIDRRIDARNPRTASRDLPSGRMTLTEALGVLFAGLALYAGSAYLVSDFCFLMSIPTIEPEERKRLAEHIRTANSSFTAVLAQLEKGGQ